MGTDSPIISRKNEKISHFFGKTFGGTNFYA